MTDRPFTTGLYFLRCLQLGLTLDDLNLIEEGAVTDLLVEKSNDSEEWQELAAQDDYDRF